jgi:hypothetical protein
MSVMTLAKIGAAALVPLEILLSSLLMYVERVWPIAETSGYARPDALNRSGDGPLGG